MKTQDLRGAPPKPKYLEKWCHFWPGDRSDGAARPDSRRVPSSTPLKQVRHGSRLKPYGLHPPVPSGQAGLQPLRRQTPL
jgi:hypothetical protein